MSNMLPILMILVITMAAGADTLKDRAGTCYQGKVKAFENGMFTVILEDGTEKTFPANGIQAIRFESPENAPSSTPSGKTRETSKPAQKSGSHSGNEEWSDTSSSEGVFRSDFEAKSGGVSNASSSSTDIMDKEWMLNALKVPQAINIEIADFKTRKMELAGKLIKLKCTMCMDMEQLGSNLYIARIGVEGSWASVFFPKEGLQALKRVPECRDYWSHEKGAPDTYSFYGVVLSDQLRQSIYQDYWKGGDIYLVGRTCKKVMSGKTAGKTPGEVTYSW